MSVPGDYKSDTLILGLGNVLLQDEGLGVQIINRIQDQYRFEPAVDILDGGTAGLDLLPDLEDRQQVIIVDAVDFNEEPGYIGLIENDNILAKIQTKLSIHHLGLADVLSAAKLTDQFPPEIVLVGVQPESMDQNLELTETVINVVPRVIEAVLFRLNQWGIAATKISDQDRAGVFRRSYS